MRTTYQVMNAGVVTLFQGFKLVPVSAAALVQEPLAPLRLQVEEEHRLDGSAPAGVFGQPADVLGAVGGRQQ